MQHTQSRFSKSSSGQRFLVQHPKVSRFIANHLPALCPFLPLSPGAARGRQPSGAQAEAVALRPLTVTEFP